MFEALYEGTRGCGKTDALLMDFAQHVGHGYGSEWRGILFRRTYPELADVIEKANKWFPRIWPTAKYNASEHYWKFPDGETLYFRHFMRKEDYNHYHGHSYPWQGWEELTTWPTPDCYTSMISCARSTVKGIPIKIRATTNPSGVGHNWVKKRFRLPVTMGYAIGPIITDSRNRDGDIDPPRVAIHGHLTENKILMHADPSYLPRLKAAARSSHELRAWVHGDWNIVAGGMFDDVWDSNIHVIPNLPFTAIPRNWRINRSYDHGQSHPFSVGWWAESNGEAFRYGNRVYGQVRGDLYRIAEWYGWNGTENEGVRMLSIDIAAGIRDRESDWGLKGRVRPGPADSSIFDPYEGTKTIAGDMAKMGIHWLTADKSAGSRKQGWEQIRKMLIAAREGYRELPGLWVCDRCEQFQRTVPALSRDEKDPDDVNTESEDHIADELRYRLRKPASTTKSGAF